jgi:hypothetical protein
MRRTLLVGIITAAVVALVAVFAVPALAHGGPDDGGTTFPDQEAWEGMWEACANGDWEAMVEAMEEVFADMPCFNGDYDTRDDGETQEPGTGWSWGGGHGHMGGGWQGHMGGSWGGHMGGGMMSW